MSNHLNTLIIYAEKILLVCLDGFFGDAIKRSLFAWKILLCFGWLFLFFHRCRLLIRMNWWLARFGSSTSSPRTIWSNIEKWWIALYSLYCSHLVQFLSRLICLIKLNLLILNYFSVWLALFRSWFLCGCIIGLLNGRLSLSTTTPLWLLFQTSSVLRSVLYCLWWSLNSV